MPTIRLRPRAPVTRPPNPNAPPPPVPSEFEPLRDALSHIPCSATLGKHPAERVIGMALRHAKSDVPTDVGIDLCAWWGDLTGTDPLTALVRADPDYSATAPTTVASVFKLAREHGWTGETRETFEPPDPEPLPRLPSVPDFPIGILPEALQGWVKDAADRARFRPDFAAVAIMSALGSVIGRKLGIRLKQFDDWTEYANVWGVLVGAPSSLKSPAMRDAMRPFKALQVRADEANEAERKDYEADVAAFKLRKEGRKKAAVKALTKDPDATIDLGGDAAPDEPIARTYWTSDVNEASLGVLLKNNPNGVLIERDELSALLSGLEDDSRADLRGMLLSGWSGKEGYRFDRIMRGTIYIPKFAVSMVGGIQPGPLALYVRGAATGERADGLLQRFQLLVWPDPAEFRYIDRRPDPSAKAAAMAVFERADALDGSAIGMTDEHGDEPPFVRLSGDAQALFIEWYTAFMRERREAESNGGDGPLASHFGKYPGLVAKLALITHVADEPDAREVSRRTLLKALAWLEYLTPHAIRAYHAAASPETDAAELLLARVKRGDLPPKFGPRDVYRKCWKGLDDRAGVKKACQLLRDYGWLIEVDQAERKFGRPSDPVYAVSPKVEVAP